MEANETRLEAQDLNQQGALLLKTGNLEGAKAKFDKALDVDPMLMDTYKNYGDLYMALQEYQEAKNSYKKAMLIEKNGLLHFLYGNACFMNDELHEGLENYNMAISEGYDSDEMMFFMGMAYEHMNDDKVTFNDIYGIGDKINSKIIGSSIFKNGSTTGTDVMGKLSSVSDINISIPEVNLPNIELPVLRVA